MQVIQYIWRVIYKTHLTYIINSLNINIKTYTGQRFSLMARISHH